MPNSNSESFNCKSSEELLEIISKGNLNSTDAETIANILEKRFPTPIKRQISIMDLEMTGL